MNTAKKARTFSFVDYLLGNAVRIYNAGDDIAKADPVAEFELTKLPQPIRDRLAIAGLRTVLQQRTSDIEAGPAKLRGMNDMYAYWCATGQWERPREGFSGNRIPAWLLAAVQAAKPTLSAAQALASIEKAAKDADKDTWAGLLKKYEPFRPAGETAPADITDL